jgi:hypothetical protein
LSVAALSPARPPSLTRCPVGPTCRRQFLHPRSPPLSLSRGLGSPVAEPLPRASPFLSLRRGPALSDPPSPRPPWTGECALAHVAGFLGHDARAPSSLFRALPVPALAPPPHFAQLRPLSRSALAARHRWRPAPAFPTIQLAGDRAKPPRAPPRGETPLPVLNFPSLALCLANFGIAGAQPRRSTMLARCPV